LSNLNWKGFGRKLQWAGLYHPEYFEEGARKILEKSVSIIQVCSKMSIPKFWNRKQGGEDRKKGVMERVDGKRDYEIIKCVKSKENLPWPLDVSGLLNLYFTFSFLFIPIFHFFWTSFLLMSAACFCFVVSLLCCNYFI
jgi:hypothetical protein